MEVTPLPETTSLDTLVLEAWKRGMDVIPHHVGEGSVARQMEASLRLEVGGMQKCVGDGGTVRDTTYHDSHSPIADADADEKTTLPEMVASVVAQANLYLARMATVKTAGETFILTP